MCTLRLVPLRKTFLRTGTDRKVSLSCELSVGTNGSNTKETFLETSLYPFFVHTKAKANWEKVYSNEKIEYWVIVMLYKAH